MSLPIQSATFEIIAVPGDGNVPVPIVGKPSFLQTEASVLLDLLRGLAALAVLGEHWRNLFFLDYPLIPEHRTLFAVPYVMTGAGRQAVLIFFVLSGYLISGSIFRSLRQNQWSWRFYVTHRVVRLWTVVLPGLLLCLLWDRMGIGTHAAPLLYTGNANRMVIDVTHLLSFKLFMGNIFFLQNVTCPTFGSDGALWSLAYEFWYYLLFPLGLLAVLPRSSWKTRVLCGAGFVLVAWFVGRNALMMFPVWLLGSVLAILPAPRLGVRARWAMACVYAPLVFFLAKYRGPGATQEVWILPVMTFLMIWVLLSANERAMPEAAWVRGSRWLASFSFTLYVVHTPLLVFLSATLSHGRQWVPDAVHIASGFGVLALVLGYAYAVAWVTELRTDRVRGWAERKLGLSRKRDHVASPSSV